MGKLTVSVETGQLHNRNLERRAYLTYHLLAPVLPLLLSELCIDISSPTRSSTQSEIPYGFHICSPSRASSLFIFLAEADRLEASGFNLLMENKASKSRKACYLLGSRLFNTHKVYLAPQPGLEPGTYGLTVRRSTN